MAAWLFTWNPKHYSWDEPLEGYKNMKSEIDQIGFSFQRWTCGNTKKISPGDLIFLIRLGTQKSGIVASGIAVSNVFSGPHWDIDLARTGKKVNRIFVKFDRIINPDNAPVLDRVYLQQQFPKMCWTPQASGISIPDNILPKLNQMWQQFVRSVEK